MLHGQGAVRPFVSTASASHLQNTRYCTRRVCLQRLISKGSICFEVAMPAWDLPALVLHESQVALHSAGFPKRSRSNSCEDTRTICTFLGQFNADRSKNLAECIFGFQVCLSSADLSLRVSCQLHPSHALRMVCAQPASGPFLGKI